MLQDTLIVQNPRNGQTIPHGNDANLIAEFYKRAVRNNFKSEREGRPVHEDAVFIKIYTPGDRHSVIDRKATENDKARFLQQWAAFERQGQQVIEGTPLSEWPYLSVSQVADYNGLHIYTVEQLAGLSDAQISKLGHGGREVNRMAQAFLEKAAKSAAAPAAAAEVARLQEELTAKDEQIKELAARLDALEAKTKRKGGE